MFTVQTNCMYKFPWLVSMSGPILGFAPSDDSVRLINIYLFPFSSRLVAINYQQLDSYPGSYAIPIYLWTALQNRWGKLFCDLISHVCNTLSLEVLNMQILALLCSVCRKNHPPTNPLHFNIFEFLYLLFTTVCNVVQFESRKLTKTGVIKVLLQCVLK